MRKIQTLSLLLLIVLFISCVQCIFPPPKYQKLSFQQFLQISNICNIRQIIQSEQNIIQTQNSHLNKVLSMFKQAGAQPKYYLNKILKRKNNNQHCLQDLFQQKDSQKNHQDNNLINLKIQVDQSKIIDKQGYLLQISKSSPHILITVKNYSGYVYALQTLSQIINNNKIPIGKIQDGPLVSHRGIMIDTARHFLKYQTIARLIQSMPLSKLNILHWHFSDDEFFSLRLNSHPELAESSAYKPGQYYTVDQVKTLIALGKKNGVSIIPEVDSPAHVRSWGLDQKWKQQNITIICPKGQGYNAQLDLSKPIVYQLAQDIYKQIDSIFSDSPYIHLGGDQVFGACWDLRPDIKTFMASKNISDYAQLQTYWRGEVKKALPKNRTIIFWRNDANISVSTSDIIHYWGLQADIPKILANSTSKLILSTSDYCYFDHGYGNIWFNNIRPYITWKQIYKGFTPFPKGVDRSRILGAQVTLWAEQINDDTLQMNIWMRATSFALKVWSQQTLPFNELVKGMVSIQRNLVNMGVSPSPVTSQFCEYFPDKCVFDG